MATTATVNIRVRMKRQRIAHRLALAVVWVTFQPCWGARLYVWMIRPEWRMAHGGKWEAIDKSQFSLTCEYD